MKIKLTKELERIELIRQDLESAILNLPDNPRIHRITDNPRCFTINSRDIFNPNKYGFTDMRIKNSCSVFYHDFKAQYRKIVSIINKSDLENILHNINTIVTTGRFQHNEFHPDVVNHLKQLMRE